MTSERYRVGFDIGGTFTDFALYDGAQGRIQIHKALTTPADPWRGAIEGIHTLLANAGLAFSDVAEIVHGTTLVTNALIEGKGAKTGLLTTRGFRDVMESGREQRYDIYDLFLKYPEGLVPRKFRRVIGERMLASGTPLRPVDPDEVRREAEQLRLAGVTSLAVCFLHSYRNPEHEREVGALLEAEFPDFSVSLSSEVAPEIREYERVCTTAANAFVRPLMDNYLQTLEAKLRERGFAGRLFLMLSSGGLASPEVARRFPIRLLESGPAGGALATGLISRTLERPDLISFDMGGTTAKTAMVRDHAVPVAPMMEVARVHRFKKGSGLPVRSPVVDMIEIGAGGGSVARLDEVRLLKVGPESASSNPGPVCYGLGGEAPTVTDANLVLGYLDPAAFLGGRMALDASASRRALEGLGAPIGLDAVAAAWGVYTIVCENMAAAARSHIVEKGCDPRAFAMVAFGGAGPLHAAKVARILGVGEVIIPPASGAASAIGFLTAPASFETVRSAVFGLQSDLDFGALNGLLEEIEAESRANLPQSGLRAAEIRVERMADMRIKGQMNEISVAAPGGVLTAASLSALRAEFIRVYEQLFHAVPEGAVIEALSWRVRVSGPAPQIDMRPFTPDARAPNPLKGVRPLYFGDGFVEAKVYDRYALRPGEAVIGPAVIEERESTTVLHPGDRVTVDDGFNLRLQVAQSDKAVLGFRPDASFEEIVARIEADPVGLEIMWGRLANIIDEGWDAVVRTAFSLIIADAQDFSLAVFDSRGEILVHSPRAQPVFNLSLPLAIKAVLARIPEASLEPGDVLVTNDPWLASGHLFDVALVTPVFHDGRIVAYIGTIGHVSDIGGTMDQQTASEIYEEGLQIPPMKLMRAGRPNADLFALIRENVRTADLVVGDLHALIAASHLAAARLHSFLAEYGLPDLTPLAHIFQNRSEAAMREAIRAVPDGVYRSQASGQIGEDFLTIPLRIEVSGDQVVIDHEGAPGQSPRGGYNCTLNYTKSHSLFPMKCLLTPGVRGNAGCYKPFEVRAPEGSIMNCRKPAPVNSRQVTGWFLGPNIFSALRDALPDKVRAYSGQPALGAFFDLSNNEETSIGHVIAGGGQGASARDDGRSGLLFPIGGTTVSTELFEVRVNVVVEEKQFDTDSGGPGRHRGGLGQVIVFSRIPGDNRSVLFKQALSGMKLTVPRMQNGEPGGSVFAHVVGADGGRTELAMAELGRLSQDERLEIHTAGGYGFGDPLERDLAAIQADLDGDYVSPAFAEAEYGCVISPDGRVDSSASADMRARLRRTASPVTA
ncbi:MAG: hydantoinase B/oxoprolinase family protein [Caulobacteraceae bacterium]